MLSKAVVQLSNFGDVLFPAYMIGYGWSIKNRPVSTALDIIIPLQIFLVNRLNQGFRGGSFQASGNSSTACLSVGCSITRFLDYPHFNEFYKKKLVSDIFISLVLSFIVCAGSYCQERNVRKVIMGAMLGTLAGVSTYFLNKFVDKHLLQKHRSVLAVLEGKPFQVASLCWYTFCHFKKNAW